MENNLIEGRNRTFKGVYYDESTLKFTVEEKEDSHGKGRKLSTFSYPEYLYNGKELSVTAYHDSKMVVGEYVKRLVAKKRFTAAEVMEIYEDVNSTIDGRGRLNSECKFESIFHLGVIKYCGNIENGEELYQINSSLTPEQLSNRILAGRTLVKRLDQKDKIGVTYIGKPRNTTPNTMKKTLSQPSTSKVSESFGDIESVVNALPQSMEDMRNDIPLDELLKTKQILSGVINRFEELNNKKNRRFELKKLIEKATNERLAIDEIIRKYVAEDEELIGEIIKLNKRINRGGEIIISNEEE